MSAYRQGITLRTPQTEKWTPEQIAMNDRYEQKMVFSDFHDEDQGRSRKLRCVCATGADAAKVVEALNAARLAAIREVREWAEGQSWPTAVEDVDDWGDTRYGEVEVVTTKDLLAKLDEMERG